MSEETIGKRLRRLRTERNLSQRELASPGVSYAYISRIEAGARTPSVKALRKLADKLDVPESYLEGVGVAWHDLIRTALFFRIMDDRSYTQRRLGREPAELEVWAAIAKHSERATDRLAEALDSFEEDVWDELGRSEEPLGLRELSEAEKDANTVGRHLFPDEP